jgi:NMD protein affecting ribosome stability and mRNA decay
MRGNKRYTNATFTKRVDHEAGRHRTVRAQPEPTVCGICGAVYKKRRWVANNGDTLSKELGSARVTLCPACKRKKEGVPSGYLLASGSFLAAHREEIEHLLRNEAARAAEDNPLAQVMDWKGKGKGLTLTTTTEHLAQRLGHALEKAFDGEVQYDFSHENKLARVSWHRD